MKNKVKLFRVMRELTQEELAKRLDVSRQTINAIENQKYNPSLELAFKMSKVFGVRMRELFKE